MSARPRPRGHTVPLEPKPKPPVPMSKSVCRVKWQKNMPLALTGYVEPVSRNLSPESKPNPLPARPNKFCRLKWRRPDPLGLSVYPGMSFVKLPREIRDRIYHHALVALKFITVSSLTRHQHLDTNNSG